jgi:hypothetical protein
MCAHCKQVRTGDGEWMPLEAFLRKHVEFQFTHGICPRCVDVLYAGADLETPAPGPMGAQ